MKRSRFSSGSSTSVDDDGGAVSAKSPDGAPARDGDGDDDAGDDDLENVPDDSPETKTNTEWVTQQIDARLPMPPRRVAGVSPPEPVSAASLAWAPPEESTRIHPGQVSEAEELFSTIINAIESSGASLESYDRFELLIQNPNLVSLYNQNVSRLESFILHYQDRMNPRFFERHTTTVDVDGESQRRTVTTDEMVNSNNSRGTSIANKCKRWISAIEHNPRTLFLVVHDEAHYEATAGGGADRFINDDVVRTSPNVITLFVSATPYNLLTTDSQIPLCNIHTWQNDGGDADDTGWMYYGLRFVRAYLKSVNGCFVVKSGRVRESSDVL